MAAIVAAIALFTSASHVGICVGPAVGAGFIRRRASLAVYVAGVLLGAYTQGALMSRAVFNPSICTLATTTAIAVVPSLAGIPLSLNFALYTSQIGCSLLRGLGKLATASIYWVTLLTLTALLSLAITQALRARLSSCRKPAVALRASRLTVYALSALMSYVVGANTFGFLIHFTSNSVATQALLILAIAIGALAMHAKSLERVAYRFFRIGPIHAITCYSVSISLLEIATLLSIPLPASLTITTALYFSGRAAPFKLMRTRSYLTYLLVQSISIPAALGTGVLIALLLP
ncbi:MAG: hypothetical protein GXO32_02320 [Crenarchaeota archaeon]|nr:hypothetical protein [Thermoproteota archaeon]